MESKESKFSTILQKMDYLMKSELSEEEYDKFDGNIKNIVQLTKLENMIHRFKSLPFQKQQKLLVMAYKYKKVLFLIFGPSSIIHAGWEWYFKKKAEIKKYDDKTYNRIQKMEYLFKKSKDIDMFQNIIKTIVDWENPSLN